MNCTHAILESYAPPALQPVPKFSFVILKNAFNRKACVRLLADVSPLGPHSFALGICSILAVDLPLRPTVIVACGPVTSQPRYNEIGQIKFMLQVSSSLSGDMRPWSIT